MKQVSNYQNTINLINQCLKVCKKFDEIPTISNVAENIGMTRYNLQCFIVKYNIPICNTVGHTKFLNQTVGDENDKSE